MRVLVRSIIGLQVVFSLLIFAVMFVTQDDDRWCYRVSFEQEALTWYLIDPARSQLVEMHDPILSNGTHLRVFYPEMPYYDFFTALNFRLHPNRQFLTDTVQSSSSIHWSGNYRAYVTTNGRLDLKTHSGRWIRSHQIDGENQSESDYLIYRFTIDGQILIYYNDYLTHLLTIPDLQPLPFSPIPTDQQTTISWSPSDEAIFTYNAEQVGLYYQNQTRYFAEPHRVLADFEWAADAQTIALHFVRPSADALYSPSDLVIYTAQGETKTLITNQPIEHLVWHGDRLWFWRNQGPTWQLIEYDRTLDQTTIRIPQADQVIAFSPDQTQILFYRKADSAGQIWLWDGQRELQLAAYPAPPTDSRAIVWTDDGRYVLIRQPADHPRQVQIIPVANPAKARLLSADAFEYPFLQERGHFFYYQWNDRDQQRLYWFNLYTDTTQQLARSDQISIPRFPISGGRAFWWQIDSERLLGVFWPTDQAWRVYRIPATAPPPEGSWFRTVIDQQLLLGIRDGSGFQLVTPEGSRTISYPFEVFDLSFSPDTRYAILHGDTLAFIDLQTTRQYTIPKIPLELPHRWGIWQSCAFEP